MIFYDLDLLKDYSWYSVGLKGSVTFTQVFMCEWCFYLLLAESEECLMRDISWLTISWMFDLAFNLSIVHVAIQKLYSVRLTMFSIATTIGTESVYLW